MTDPRKRRRLRWLALLVCGVFALPTAFAAGVVGGGGVVAVYNWDRGLQRATTGTGLIGTTATTTAITVGRVGILTTVAGDLQVDGATTLVGAETVTGLLTVTSPTGSGAAGLMGTVEEFRVQNTEAATAGATIRNPGFQSWRGQFWSGAASVAGSFGTLGVIVNARTIAPVVHY